MITDVPIDAMQCSGPGKSSKGVYISNRWYGNQDILLRAADIDRNAWFNGKLQFGWQPGTGLDWEQGMKLEVKTQRLPFFVWNKRNINRCRKEGLNWGFAIGSPFLYEKFTPTNERLKSAIMFPLHSAPEYLTCGWEQTAADFKKLADAHGLGATMCLHPEDYQNKTILSSLEKLDICVTCCGDKFYNRYMHRFVDLVSAHELVVVDRASTSLFYAAVLKRPIMLMESQIKIARDDYFENDEYAPNWLRQNYPWAVAGGYNQDQALSELGQEYVDVPRIR